MASRLDEIGASAQRARQDLDRLIGQLEALRSVIAESPWPAPVPDPAPPAPVPEPEPPPIPEPTPPPIPEPTPGPELVPDPPGPDPPPVVARAAVPEGDVATRLVAMKMAIDGTTREQIESELAAKFGSADRAALLDEVLLRAGR